MAGFVDAAVGVERVLRRWKNGVELRFLDVGSVAVDRFQCGIGVDRETIGAEADNGAWGLSAPTEEGKRDSHHISREIARTQDVCRLSMHDRLSTSL